MKTLCLLIAILLSTDAAFSQQVKSPSAPKAKLPIQAFCDTWHSQLNKCEVGSKLATVDIRTNNSMILPNLLWAWAISGKINRNIYMDGTLLGYLTRDARGMPQLLEATQDQ